MVDKKETTSQFLQNRIKKFSRVEKAFYLSIAFTALVLAVSIIFMQTRLLQVQSDLTKINAQIEEKKTELDDAKQEVNELIRSERLKEIADKKRFELNNENIRNSGVRYEMDRKNNPICGKKIVNLQQKNRRIVGKYLSFLAVALSALFGQFCLYYRKR